MKIEWFASNVTSVESPDKEECAILGVILASVFDQSSPYLFVVREPLCDVGTPS